MARTSSFNIRDLVLRAALGTAGGASAWAVTRWTPAGEVQEALQGGFALASLTLPVILLGGYGTLRIRTLALWIPAVLGVAVLAGLDRAPAAPSGDAPPIPGVGVLVLVSLALAIGHVLVRAREEGDKAGRNWPRHFAIAWSDGFRAVLSAAFVGALIGLCGLTAALFEVIGLKAVGEFLFRPGVLWPVAGLTFGLGVHFTAGRTDLVEGARALGLGLLAWLLPLMALLATAFLAALPFTGLTSLWNTGSASALLMSACLCLILLSNAAVQDETRETRIHPVLRYALRLSGLLTAPIMVIASAGLFLRIDQHGLTPDRVRALAGLLTLGVFAGGYALSALSRRSWIDAFGRANLTGVVFALATALVLLSPIGDPDRLAVGDQVQRLVSGRVAPDRFDFDLLRFDTGARGRDVLRQLSVHPGDSVMDVEIRRRASEAQSRSERLPVRLAPPVLAFVGPGSIPMDFAAGPATVRCDKASPCWAGALDLDGDGDSEVLLQQGASLAAWRRATDGWRLLGELVSACPQDRAAFRSGDFGLLPPEREVQDLRAGASRLRLAPVKAECRE